MNLSLIKKHPYAAGAVVIIGGLIVFVLMRNSGTSAASNTADGTIDTSGYSSDPRIAAIQAGADAQSAQTAGAVQMAGLQAQVINNQTQVALDVAQVQAQRDVDIAQINANGALSKEQIDSLTAEYQDKLAAGVQSQAIAADVEKTQITSSEHVAVAGTQAAAYESAVNASTQQEKIAADASVAIEDSRNNIVLAEIANQSKIIAAAGQDKGRSSTGWAQIISAFEGNGPQAIAANQPAAAGSSPAGVLNGIANIGKSIFGGLFG